MVIKVLQVPDDFQALHYHRRIMLDERALPLVDLLWEIDEEFRSEHPEEWEQQRAETDARIARRGARHILRHDATFAAARKGLIPGVDEISSGPPRRKPKADRKKAATRARAGQPPATTREERSPAHLGFKIVTSDNVLQTDPVVATMVTLNKLTGEVHSQAPEDWLRLVTGIVLDEKVPLEVRKMFTFAQGGMCYGHWYYPLLTLIAHDLLRVADFATVEACRERHIAARTFEKRIVALVAAETIPAPDEQLWTAIRHARNRATHPASQSIYGFSMAFDMLRVICGLINRIVWMEP